MKNRKNCFFCGERARKQKVMAQNRFWFARWDDHPVSPGHALLFPKRHVESMLNLSFLEFVSLLFMLRKVWKIMVDQFNPDGYNFGINYGEAAGQGHGHLHWHFMPRFRGDVPHDPQGGVRWVIPAKARESQQSRPKNLISDSG